MIYSTSHKTLCLLEKTIEGAKPSTSIFVRVNPPQVIQSTPYPPCSSATGRNLSYQLLPTTWLDIPTLLIGLHWTPKEALGMLGRFGRNTHGSARWSASARTARKGVLVLRSKRKGEASERREEMSQLSCI